MIKASIVLKPLDPRMKHGYRTDVPHQIKGYMIPAGFDWDGATIPRPFWSIIGGPWHPQVMRASLIHDWLYWTRLCDRKTADKILRDCLREDGCTWAKASAMYRAVRIFGGMFFKRTKIDVEYAAIFRAEMLQDCNPDSFRFAEAFPELF
jgi:hypothetical protein